MVLFVFGGLLVLQASDDINAPKIAYGLIAIAVVVSAALVTWRNRRVDDVVALRPWLAASAALLGMLAISLPVALAHGIGFVPWLRQVVSYGLFAVAPIVALDARRTMTRREVTGWLMLASGLAAVAFSIAWMERRHIADLGIERFVLPSGQLAYAGFSVACAYAIGSRRGALWAAAAGAIFGLLLVTGTRTTFLLLAIPTVLAVIAGRSRVRQAAIAGLVGTATAWALVLGTVLVLNNSGIGLTPGLGTPAPSSGLVASPGPAGSSGPKPAETPRTDLIGERIGSVQDLVSDPASQQSFSERIAQTKVAFVTFLADPWFGAGPGHLYQWTNTSGVPVETFSLDTPLMVPAEFGLMGILVYSALVVVAVSFIRFAWRSLRGPEFLSIVGVMTAFAVTGLLGPPMDDKGAAYALALVLALSLGAIDEARALV